MNNRFKFRVWYDPQCDGIEPRYFYDVQNMYDGSISGLGWMSCFGDFFDDEQYCLEQCTGLTDKNGKLIYEGDVVIGSWNTRLIVFWDAISASYRVKPLDNCGGDRELHYYSNMDGILYYNFEIIGNVHEMEVEK